MTFAVVLTACDQRSETAKVVQAQSTSVQVASGGGNARPLAADHQKVLGSAQKATEPVSKEGSSGEQSAASLLLATTQRSLADYPLQNAISLDMRARNLMTRIDGCAAEWSARSSTAAAAEGFAPASQIEQLNAFRAEKSSQMTALQNELTGIKTRVEGLRAQAKTKMDAAGEKQSTYTRMMGEAVKLSAAQAAEMVTEANVHRREADRLRLEGSSIDVEADRIAPEIGEVQKRVDELAKHIAEADRSISDLRKRAEQFSAEAQAARSAATVAANDLDRYIGQIDALYDGVPQADESEVGSDDKVNLKTAYENAISAFTKARTSANAAKDAPAFSKLASGEASIGIANAQWGWAQSLDNYASHLENLLLVTPKLPQAESYAERAKQLRELHTAALTEAAAAYDAAVSAMSTARVTGPAKERLERLGELLDKAKKVTGEEKADVVATFNLPYKIGARASGEAAAPAAGGVDPALTSTLTQILDAMKTQQDPAAFIEGPEGIKKLLSAATRMQAQIAAKFGSDGGAALSQMSPVGAGGMENLSVADATITMTGDSTADVEIGGQTLKFVKVEGNWKLDGASLLGAQGQMILPMADAIATVFDDLAKGIESGKYADVNAVMKDMQGKIMGAMTGVGGPNK